MLTNDELFIQVVESGSFKKAAENLNCEPSSVSRRIAALEASLQVKLLRRSTRHSTTTELGQFYYERMRQIIDAKIALNEEISSGVNQLKGNFRIAAPVDFGAQFVVPVVRQMQEQAPELTVELLLGSQLENLQEKNLDVAVRIGALRDSDLIAKNVGQNHRVLVASPDYLNVHNTPETIEQLAEHNFIFYSPSQARSDIVFADGCRCSHSKIKSNITINSVSAIRQLVHDGAGIHLGPMWAFKDDIEQGKVVPLLPERPLQSFPVSAVYLARSYLPFKTREFTRLLAAGLNDAQQ
ncbi:LysR family transcriptional regulator [Marinobacter sp.]|uniref:LysR family transcriptional regulator n=1 Tax=Marinobacter sp. TaxID=50741 RepID=UPI0025BD3EBE|nr:LysR family transcriptional regulator [Marinobacter sp.]